MSLSILISDLFNITNYYALWQAVNVLIYSYFIIYTPHEAGVIIYTPYMRHDSLFIMLFDKQSMSSSILISDFVGT